MHIKNTVLAAAALSARVGADFLVLTNILQDVVSMNEDQYQSWMASAVPVIQSQLVGIATQSSYIARATSVLPVLENFARTATVSLPPEVTGVYKFEIYTTVPEWYTQLPSDVRAFYDEVGKQVESIANGIAPGASRTGGAPAQATANAVGKVEVGVWAAVGAAAAGLAMM